MRAWYRNYSGGRPPKPTRAFDPRQRLRPLVATFLRRVCVFSLTGSPTIWPRPQLAALGSPVVGITLPHRISGTSTDEMWGEGALGGCWGGGKSEGGGGDGEVMGDTRILFRSISFSEVCAHLRALEASADPYQQAPRVS